MTDSTDSEQEILADRVRDFKLWDWEADPIAADLLMVQIEAALRTPHGNAGADRAALIALIKSKARVAGSDAWEGGYYHVSNAEEIADAILALFHPISKGGAETDPLADLVARFSAALLEKLRAAQAKGRSGWDDPTWERECVEGLHRHANKGDPRDVAAYAAFCWHHGWATTPSPLPSSGELGKAIVRLLEYASHMDSDANADDAEPNLRKDIEAVCAAARPSSGEVVALERLKFSIDARLNAVLCEMKPDYDDSIVGFNEAWDIVRKAFEEHIERAASAKTAGE